MSVIGKNKVNASLATESRRLYRFSLVITIFLFVTILSSFLSNRLYRDYDKKGQAYLRRVNSYIVALNGNGMLYSSEIREEAEELYPDLASGWRSLPDPMKGTAFMEPPQFGDQKSRDDYYREVVDFVTSFRSDQSDLVDRIYHYQIIFLLLALTLCLVSFRKHSLWNKHQNQFFTDLTDGVNKIDRVLRYEETRWNPHPLAESQDLARAIYRIEESIHFNRNLQDMDVRDNLDSVLRHIHSLVSKDMECDRIALAFVNRSREIIAESFFALYDKTYLSPGFRESLDTSSLGEVLRKNQNYRILDDLPSYVRTKHSPTTEMLVKEGIQSSLTLPLYFRQKGLAFVFISSKKVRAYDEAKALKAIRIVDLLKNKLYIEYILQSVIADTAQSFVSLMARKDNETSEHIKRMSRYSQIIARAYSSKVKKLSPRFIREILWYAPLHDIGKVGIPDAILLKEGPLDKEERQIINEHVQIGSAVIQDVNSLLSQSYSFNTMEVAIQIIEDHHESYDGTGYPKGLKGENISLAGRIVAIADVFDALTSHRPYKSAYSVEKSIGIMKDEMKGHFDPLLMECFLDSLPEINEVRICFQDGDIREE